MKLKTGDKVRILAGKDRGKEGKIIQVFPRLNRVVVENINMMTRHLGSRGRGQKGQKIQFPAPLHISNIKVIAEKSGIAGRVGYKFIDKDGKKTKVRIVRAKGKTEDLE